MQRKSSSSVEETKPKNVRVDKSRRHTFGLAPRFATPSMPKYGPCTTASKELKDVLEKKIEDLSRQLAEEKQTARQTKVTLTRCQRDLARARSHDKPKEHLSKELEHEKMLRVEAERRLHEMTKESESCRIRLENLQVEFKKMENQVTDMMQYKSKIDQLKQEKSSLAVTYENSIHKFKNHITDLERENMMMLNEVKKLESQINCKTDGRDRSKLLLERLRMLEGENSSLVLENEQQRGQYEKCLDEIANQVVQALLAQKMLREECLKLQNRVRDLELQNRQLIVTFHQRMKAAAEAAAQNGNGMVLNEELFAGSIESLQSMFSEQMTENIASMPKMSSPPPWLQDRLPGDRQSFISITGSMTSVPDIDLCHSQGSEFHCRTEIETEFPATPSSPKSKHVNVIERKCDKKRSASVTSLSSTRGPTKQRTLSTSSLSRARGLSFMPPQRTSLSQESGIQHATTNDRTSESTSSLQGSINADSNLALQSESAASSLHKVPLNQSNPSISRDSPTQGQTLQPASKIPMMAGGKQTDESRIRRNSLKAEFSIRMGVQSTASRNSPNTSSNLKPPNSRPSSSQGSRSSSATPVSDQGHSRSPSMSSSRSNSAGSRIPTSSRAGTAANSSKSQKPVAKEPASQKLKSNNKNIPTKLVPPKSPQLRYSGIRTTLKNEVPSRVVTKSDTPNSSTVSMQSSVNVNMRSVYSINQATARQGNQSAKSTDSVKTPVSVKGDKPVTHRGETHYPIMGLTNLNHSSPKGEDSSKVYANLINVPSQFTSSSVSSASDSVNANTGPNDGTLTRGQYFYDYSDEDSDFNRPVSKDFSIASTVSLDELLDQTLENIETPVDFDITADFLFKSPQGVNEKNNNINKNDVGLTPNEGDVESKSSEKKTASRRSSRSDIRLQGKPDIVKDTEECEQRNLKKSLTISQIPGSSIPGYRAKRPKSLILGAKDKKFLYCEYGSSSSSDSSDDEWSYQFSYAKNVKQQEIQSKVVKSLKAGKAKVIESPKSDSSGREGKAGKSSKDSKVKKDKQQDSVSSTSPQSQKSSSDKKPSKIPPPVAAKPARKKSSPTSVEHLIPRPKSVEICVNTALSVANAKTCYSYLNKDVSKELSKSGSERYLHSTGNGTGKMDNPELTSTFDEVKVERSGSKDDGYSTMSSDVQPEVMEKYSDVLESSSNSNEIRNSNLSLSSQNSFSSEDRQSGHGSLSRVKAMKLKYEMESHKNQMEKELTSPKSPTSPPTSPIKTVLKSPKHQSDKSTGKLGKQGTSLEKTTMAFQSKISKPKVSQCIVKELPVNKPKSAIPVPKQYSKKDTNNTIAAKPETKELAAVGNTKTEIVNDVLVSKKEQQDEMSFKTPEKNVQEENLSCTLPQTSTPKNIMDQFNQLTYFTPTLDHVAFLREGCDSNSSLSDRGSDLTSLHISEDNILSDIPEERDGYESSVGHRSETTSLSSIPPVCSVKKSPEKSSHHGHSVHHQTVKFQFQTSLKRFWSSNQGLVRAHRISDYDKQKQAKDSADYEELYGGCLNIESLLERSSSESDMFTRGDKPEVVLFPGLRRSRSESNIVIDEIIIEERVQAIMKHNVMQQISQNVESADKDEAQFTSFVEMLVQKGHVMETDSFLHDRRVVKEEPQKTEVLSNMAVSTFSSMGNNSCNDSSMGNNSSCKDFFVPEEKQQEKDAIVVEQQKRFNSKFYSLCNTGSSKSISEKSDSTAVANDKDINRNERDKLMHTCDNGNENCKKCQMEKNQLEFDDISRQIESLSRTVNELHRSLSSLNSDNSDDGSESNEGDSRQASAIGNKDLDGYQWVEDEFFLSPYGGEIILGGSPFSNTGASCDWMNEYSEHVSNFDEFGGQEALHEDPVSDFPMELQKPLVSKKKVKPPQNSILAESIDKEGNFDSHHFISKRLMLEEERRKSLKMNDVANSDVLNLTDDISLPLAVRTQQRATTLGSQGILKEDLRMTPEKDIDDVEILNEERKAELLHNMIGSQDSLDDNIGVDNVMCHRLIGGKGVIRSSTSSRPSLALGTSQFIRYGDLEKQAVAAFDFLHDMQASVQSNQSDDPSRSHDQLFKLEANNFSANSYRNQMNISTTSNESRASPVKRNRRKLRPRQRMENDRRPTNGRKFSSTSADSNNDSDEDVIFSDSFCDSYSSENEENMSSNIVPNKNMTYV